MSDENRQGEQPEEQAPKWGDPVSPERQAELDALAVRQRTWAAQPEATRGDSPLKDVRLTGADAFWLAKRALAGPEGDAHALATAETHILRDERPVDLHSSSLDLLALHLERATLGGAHLERAFLERAHLERAFLQEAHLEGADLGGAHLERAFLERAHLEGAHLTTDLRRADLVDAHLEGADLREAHLERAFLERAHLEGAHLTTDLRRADLVDAHLEGADLREAHLEGAALNFAHLEGADLERAHLEGAVLWRAYLDENTRLDDVQLGPGAVRDWLDHLLFHNRNAVLFDIKWRGADLTAVPWEQVQRLGNERYASFTDGADDHRAVVRAYRQLAVQLRSQGMTDEADRFSYRAQIRQRGVLLRTFQLPQYLFSWLLYILAGYGYRPGRTLFWYVATIAVFAWGYLQVTHGVPLFGLHESVGTQPLQWYEALVLSVASFHGRGFFPQGINLGDPVAILAAGEAVIGLFVEISFIATFTQRYFANK